MVAVNGKAILLEFTTIEEMVQYLQHFCREKSVVSFELLGIKVKNLSANENCRDTSTYSLPFTTVDNSIECMESCDLRIRFSS